MTSKEKQNEPNKSRGRSNALAGSADSTVGGKIVFVFRGKEYKQDEFKEVWINGKDIC
jgi:hypothetical protein